MAVSELYFDCLDRIKTVRCENVLAMTIESTVTEVLNVRISIEKEINSFGKRLREKMLVESPEYKTMYYRFLRDSNLKRNTMSRTIFFCHHFHVKNHYVTEDGQYLIRCALNV